MSTFVEIKCTSVNVYNFENIPLEPLISPLRIESKKPKVREGVQKFDKPVIFVHSQRW